MKKLVLVILFVLILVLLAAVSVGAMDAATELVNVDFDGDTPGQPPSTGGQGQPAYLTIQAGTSILVQTSANGIATQPVVLTAQGAGQYASVNMPFDPVSEGIVRVEATVAFDGLADGYFLQTIAGTGSHPFAVVTRLKLESGQIRDAKTSTPIEVFVPNQPFRVRMDIDKSANNWSVAIDNELNGFDDDPVVSDLPFLNAVDVLPTVGGLWASLNLSSVSATPFAVAYDDLRVFILSPAPIAVDIDIKPGSYPNCFNNDGHGVIPVAVLTTDVFDASTVDPLTVTLDGAEARVKGKSGNAGSLEDVDGDGDFDLVVQIEDVDGAFQEGDTDATLSGFTYDGTQVEGTDSICIVP